MSAAYDLAKYIAETLSKGTLGSNVFCNFMPDVPKDCIAVYQYGGDPSLKGHGGGAGSLETARLQINVRNDQAQTAEETCYDIYKSLDNLAANVTINSVVYTWLHPLQPPFILEREQGGGKLFVFNMEAQRVRPS